MAVSYPMYDALRRELKRQVVVSVAVSRRGSSRCYGDLSQALLGSGRWLVVVFEVELKRQEVRGCVSACCLYPGSYEDPKAATGLSLLPAILCLSAWLRVIPSVER
jgi:hypothetical protein